MQPTFATTLNATSSPSSLTINHSPLPVLLSNHSVTLSTCHSSVNFPPACAMSVEKITLLQMHSQPNISAVFLSTSDYHQLAAIEATSDKITAHKTSITNLHFDNVQFDNCITLYNISMGKPGPVVSREWTRKVFDAIQGHATLASARHNVPSPHVSYSAGGNVMSTSGAENATSVNHQRPTVISMHLSLSIHLLTIVSAVSTLTW